MWHCPRCMQCTICTQPSINQLLGITGVVLRFLLSCFLQASSWRLWEQSAGLRWQALLIFSWQWPFWSPPGEQKAQTPTLPSNRQHQRLKEDDNCRQSRDAALDKPPCNAFLPRVAVSGMGPEPVLQETWWSVKSTGRHFKTNKRWEARGNQGPGRLKISKVYRKGGKAIGSKAIPQGDISCNGSRLETVLGPTEGGYFSSCAS